MIGPCGMLFWFLKGSFSRQNHRISWPLSWTWKQIKHNENDAYWKILKSFVYNNWISIQNELWFRGKAFWKKLLFEWKANLRRRRFLRSIAWSDIFLQTERFNRFMTIFPTRPKKRLGRTPSSLASSSASSSALSSSTSSSSELSNKWFAIINTMPTETEVNYRYSIFCWQMHDVGDCLISGVYVYVPNGFIRLLFAIVDKLNIIIVLTLHTRIRIKQQTIFFAFKVWINILVI